DLHGVRGWGDYINPLILTLAQVLKNNGFYTGAICAHDFFVSILGLEGGFDTVSKGGDLTAENITREAVLWLEKNKDKKFFLWLHYFDPHEPYKPPVHIKIEPENVRFKDDDKQVPILNERPSDPDMYGGLGGIAEYAVVEGRRDRGYYILLYDKEIKYVDEQIGILLKNLEELGLDKNTLIIITADHGEALGEHNLYFTHGRFLYDELLKVPLIMVGEFLPKNKIIKTQVELIDIFPTIMDILRIGYNKRGIDGVSLLPIIYSKNKNDKYWESYAFSEFEDKKSIRSPEWKLIYTSGNEEYELYNLKEDPQELNNLADIEKDQFKLMKAKLEEWMFRAKENISSSIKPLDEETKEKLRSLGYLQ
ncbi:sulfatase-like hydrolase/transferase, partial [Candidatus Woesearchaeota archaeon]|nr:sulfatase-like hydrolase/transferase [Candidatus Woesearchaeota archaeon]